MTKGCTIEGCGKSRTARGWCHMHYNRWKRHGDPLKVLSFPHGTPCTVEGCDGTLLARGLCQAHYRRWEKTGDVQASIPISRHKGQTTHPLYQAWAAMHARCNNANHLRYKDYGGRGIRVCERWASFEKFLKDMGERPSEMSLDRIDVNGHYEPNNCRWATHRVQNLNTRRNARFWFLSNTQYRFA